MTDQPMGGGGMPGDVTSDDRFAQKQDTQIDCYLVIHCDFKHVVLVPLRLDKESNLCVPHRVSANK